MQLHSNEMSEINSKLSHTQSTIVERNQLFKKNKGQNLITFSNIGNKRRRGFLILWYVNLFSFSFAKMSLQNINDNNNIFCFFTLIIFFSFLNNNSPDP